MPVSSPEGSSRILYLDEKSIYEDGTPEEIFENPKRPRTRAFIRQGKYRAIDIISKENDIAGLLSEIKEYRYTPIDELGFTNWVVCEIRD